MRVPRFNLAGAMIFVAVVALNLGAVRWLYDFDELLLFDALPTANILAAVGFAGLRRRRLRAFAIGFVLACALSLIAFLLWIDRNPWTAIRYLGPPFDALDRLVGGAYPDSRIAIMYVIFVVAFSIPHAALGLVGGCLTAKVWATVNRRKVRGEMVSTNFRRGGLGPANRPAQDISPA
jgi:hypothetical protein